MEQVLGLLPCYLNIFRFLSDSKAIKIICRTSKNSMEHFNRMLNQTFAVAHPRMEQFMKTVNKISKISCDFLMELNRIQVGQSRRAPLHECPRCPS